MVVALGSSMTDAMKMLPKGVRKVVFEMLFPMLAAAVFIHVVFVSKVRLSSELSVVADSKLMRVLLPKSEMFLSELFFVLLKVRAVPP